MSQEELNRYNFSGFTFGEQGDFNLIIETKTGEFSYNTQIAIELTPAERQQLISVLIKTNTKDDK
jgi:hypothetical protein